MDDESDNLNLEIVGGYQPKDRSSVFDKIFDEIHPPASSVQLVFELSQDFELKLGGEYLIVTSLVSEYLEEMRSQAERIYDQKCDLNQSLAAYAELIVACREDDIESHPIFDFVRNELASRDITAAQNIAQHLDIPEVNGDRYSPMILGAYLDGFLKAADLSRSYRPSALEKAVTLIREN
ncbi:hypothetical protein ACFL0V_03235 [Nanoarchaeota archaeon]